MNIDTLKRADGSYRKATVGDIKKMLSAEHVTHLQNQFGDVIAIRPGRMRIDGSLVLGWTVDRAPSGHTESSKFFKRRGEQVRLIRNVFRFLNGSLHQFKAGDDTLVYSNQANRDAYVLAVLGEQVLIEYEMPAGTTALVLYAAMGEMLTHIKTIPHLGLSQSWIDAIHDQGHAHLWIGMGQRRPAREPVALPAHS